MSAEQVADVRVGDAPGALLTDGRQAQALARTFADLNEAVRRTAATLSHDEDNAIGVRLDL